MQLAVVSGIALALPLLASCAESEPGDAHAAASVLAGSEQTAVKGPHGGRFLEEDGFKIEVTIYESGIPPEFRVYAFDSDLPIDLTKIQLTIELSRLGGRVDEIHFRKVDDYLLGDMVVEEPHSFDVVIVAVWNGKTYRMGYSQFEARTEIGPEALEGSGIVIEEAGAVQMKSVFELPGEIVLDPDRVAHVVPRFGGVVTEVRKKLGSKVSKGEVIAVVESRELSALQMRYIQDVHELEYAQVVSERQEQLWKKKISPEEKYLAARHELEESKLSMEGSQQALRALGLADKEIKALAESNEKNLSRYELRAPLGGVVIEKHVALGEAVEDDADIFTIADLATVLASVTVYAKDLKFVREGQEVNVMSDVLDIEVAGRVAYLGPLLGTEARTAIAHVAIDNPEGLWRPGVFVTVRLVQEEFMAAVAVRPEAIQRIRDWDVVFIQDGDLYEARPLEFGRRTEEWVEVLAGLSPGQMYVSKNSFLIKADILKSGATHDH
jgi:cobalt-zinc-cadmium efflux system membrane fusion protein